MATLEAQLLKEDVRPTLVRQCAQLVDDEVAAKGGLGGLAVKGAYKTVKAIKPGFVPAVINGLLDDWVAELEPFWTAFQGGAAGTFAGYLEARRDEVAEGLLQVTDRRAQTSSHRTAAKLYLRLRPTAKSNVASAIPGLARVVQAHLS